MPARDGAGWLVRLFADAPTFLIWLEAAIIVCALYLLWRKRKNRMSGEEKILLWFFCLTLLPSVSALIGFAVWFAADSVVAGVGAGISLFLSIVAFFGCGLEEPHP